MIYSVLAAGGTNDERIVLLSILRANTQPQPLFQVDAIRFVSQKEDGVFVIFCIDLQLADFAHETQRKSQTKTHSHLNNSSDRRFFSAVRFTLNRTAVKGPTECQAEKN
jgi:hypothetical protein